MVGQHKRNSGDDMNWEKDDLIFLIGLVVLTFLSIAKIESSALLTIAGLVGGHKVTAVIDGKIQEKP
jgi:hypothetical protein